MTHVLILRVFTKIGSSVTIVAWSFNARVPGGTIKSLSLGVNETSDYFFHRRLTQIKPLISRAELLHHFCRQRKLKHGRPSKMTLLRR